MSGPQKMQDFINHRRAAVVQVLGEMINPDLHWHDWNKVGVALFLASNGEEWGKELFFDFSSRSEKFEHKVTERRWRDIDEDFRNAGAKLLFLIAGSEGWQPSEGLADAVGGVCFSAGEYTLETVVDDINQFDPVHELREEYESWGPGDEYFDLMHVKRTED